MNTSKRLYWAYRKAPANQDGGDYALLPDDFRWLYEWHDDGSVWRALQAQYVSEGTFLAPEPLEWNDVEFEERVYPTI